MKKIEYNAKTKKEKIVELTQEEITKLEQEGQKMNELEEMHELERELKEKHYQGWLSKQTDKRAKRLKELKAKHKE